MATCIVLCSAFYLGGMDPHAKQISLGLVLFNLHKFVCINCIVLSLIYLLWSAKKQGKPTNELFRWFDACARECVMQEIRQFGNLCDSCIAYMLSGLGVLASATTILLGGWALWQSIAGHDLHHDPILNRTLSLALLSAVAYLANPMPGRNKSTRQITNRLMHKLMMNI